MRREIETRDEQGAARDVEEKQRQAGEEARVQQSTDITVTETTDKKQPFVPLHRKALGL